MQNLLCIKIYVLYLFKYFTFESKYKTLRLGNTNIFKAKKIVKPWQKTLYFHNLVEKIPQFKKSYPVRNCLCMFLSNLRHKLADFVHLCNFFRIKPKSNKILNEINKIINQNMKQHLIPCLSFGFSNHLNGRISYFWIACMNLLFVSWSLSLASLAASLLHISIS